jgi:hypothetical protein
MIEVASIGYGLTFSDHFQVEHWPLLVRFGALGPETTVDRMLEGAGHTFLDASQLQALIEELMPRPGEVELIGHPPAGLVCTLLARGYFVRVVVEE